MTCSTGTFLDPSGSYEIGKVKVSVWHRNISDTTYEDFTQGARTLGLNIESGEIQLLMVIIAHEEGCYGAKKDKTHNLHQDVSLNKFVSFLLIPTSDGSFRHRRWHGGHLDRALSVQRSIQPYVKGVKKVSVCNLLNSHRLLNCPHVPLRVCSADTFDNDCMLKKTKTRLRLRHGWRRLRRTSLTSNVRWGWQSTISLGRSRAYIHTWNVKGPWPCQCQYFGLSTPAIKTM